MYYIVISLISLAGGFVAGYKLRDQITAKIVAEKAALAAEVAKLKEDAAKALGKL